MSSLYEFYIEKEIRELTNAINSAKYISEEQKEVMIEGLLGKGTGILGRVTDADRKKAAEVEKNKRERQAAHDAKEREERAERDKKEREREKKKRYDASPAGKAEKAKKQKELEKHFASQEGPGARGDSGMYSSHGN